MNTAPIYLSREELVEIVEDIFHKISTGDSMEGFIQYSLPEEGDNPDGFRVEARYRIGNLQGQGGMRIVGRLT